MRRGGLLLFVVSALAAPGATAASTGSDKGTDRPPATLSPSAKALWMTEWTACWHERMSRLSAILSVPIKPGYTPQIAARKLSKRAMKDLYQTQRELDIGADGCRNGILWRYYHPG